MVSVQSSVRNKFGIIVVDEMGIVTADNFLQFSIVFNFPGKLVERNICNFWVRPFMNFSASVVLHEPVASKASLAWNYFGNQVGNEKKARNHIHFYSFRKRDITKFYVSLNNKPRFYINFERDKKENSVAPIMCGPISDAIEALVKALHIKTSIKILIIINIQLLT